MHIRRGAAAGHAGRPENLQAGPSQRQRAAPRQSLTPELVIDDQPAGHSAEGSAPGPASRRLFSIFRPASERKVCCCCMHFLVYCSGFAGSGRWVQCRLFVCIRVHEWVCMQSCISSGTGV